MATSAKGLTDVARKTRPPGNSAAKPLWFGNALRTTRSTFARETRALPFPEKFRRAIDFRWEAFVHGAIERGLLKDFPLRMIGRERDVNF
jgi:hypothetical protein